MSVHVVYNRSATKSKYHVITSDFVVLPNYLPCAIMPHFHTWQQSKTCTPGIALIDKTKKLLLYAEYYVANFFSTWTPDYMYIHYIKVRQFLPLIFSNDYVNIPSDSHVHKNTIYLLDFRRMVHRRRKREAGGGGAGGGQASSQ